MAYSIHLLRYNIVLEHCSELFRRTIGLCPFKKNAVLKMFSACITTNGNIMQIVTIAGADDSERYHSSLIGTMQRIVGIHLFGTFWVLSGWW